jgi:L-ascorbate metabolism protein UlaG (beta-lactamase superfamily)
MKKLLYITVAIFMIGEVANCQVSLTWFGQSTFLMKTGDGVKILMDPANPSMVKAEISENIDLVTVSHEHGDHNYVQLAKGEPVIVRGLTGTEYAKVDQTVKGIKVRTVNSFHDNQGGAQRGKNAIFIYEIKGLKVVHLGDLGHVPSADQVKEIGAVDILMIPIGGGFTFDMPTAMEVIKLLNPKVLIPMHFSPANAPAGGFRLGTVEDFLKVVNGAYEVKPAGHTETFESGKLPAKTTIYVMKTSE